MRARFDPVGNTLREIYLVSRDVTDRVALEAALRESQANLQALIESTDDLIAAYDRELRLLTFNSATAAYHRAVFGIELSAGMSLDECFPLTRVELWRQMLTATLAQGRRQIEMTRADGRLIDLTLSPIARGGQVVGVSAFARDITDRKRSEEVLRSLPKIVMKTQEDERRALARELQDSVIQDLAAMKLALETTHAREHGSASCPCISNVMTSAETILAAVRELASRLRPAIIDDLGLVAAVRSQVQRLAEEQGVKVYVSAELGEGRLRPDLELAGFRIIQEAVGNAVRHGKPREVYVRLAIEEQRLVLAVRDDGCGFNLADAPRRAVVADHLGLSVMRERAALLRGTLEITSAPGRGTEVVARLPIDAD
ncbi:MAG: PAS domain-containing sensor histidine kinase [Vicinamibacteria bacterium]|nr:PAS domain-containing sensor histidine kinase [Vicinamibacteria bacterium]